MNEVVIKVIGNYSYQTSRCLGEGVYGKVYEGQERQTRQKVAIKKIDLNTFTNDKYLQNAIFSEIYLLKRFNHPNIVRFQDVLSSKNSLYIITQFCKNGDLKELIKRKRFKQDEAFEIMRQLLSGFGELVREKIIHRDLKPANILISDGVYKIGDFGFAKYVDNFGSQMLKSCVGSPIYMAPQILERTQYTTKCDIWSLGIIFYEMIHGYPPWKARDQSQLLRTVKNVPITQVLKKSNISQKGSDFLRRTLAFSQEERISWAQLFQTFVNKIDKVPEDNQTKESSRVHSVNVPTLTQPPNGGIGYPQRNYDNQNKNPQSMTSLPTINTHNQSNLINTPHSFSNTSIPTNGNQNQNVVISPDKPQDRNKPSFYPNPVTLQVQPNPYTPSVSNSKKVPQVENASQFRQFLAYYHFYCVEMFNSYSYINTVTKSDSFAKLIFSLSALIKGRSTFCLSIVSMHSKSSKSNEELYKKMQAQHDSYEMISSDIAILLERYGLLKNIKTQFGNVVGHNDVISQDRLDKIQNYMVSVATQNAQFLSEEVKKRVKIITNRDYTLVEELDNVLDVLRLALGRNKSNTIKEIQQDDRQDDEDIKDYVARVFGKVDRLANNI